MSSSTSFAMWAPSITRNDSGGSSHKPCRTTANAAVPCAVSGLSNFPRPMYHLYILRCADDTLYTGITTDLDRRVSEHNGSGLGAKYTRGRRPVTLVYSRRFRTRSNALSEEVRVKRLSRMEKLLLIKSK